MCVTTLLNAETDEKLIRERTVRHSNTLFQDEKANREQMVQRESIGKFSNFNFQWTKTLYQNNLNNKYRIPFYIFQSRAIDTISYL